MPGGGRTAHPLAAVLPLLCDTLVSIADEAKHLMIVTDAEGHIMWCEGRRLVPTHHSWTCAACPIRDPDSGEVVGAVDVTGPPRTFHPTTLALVVAAARLAEGHLAAQLAMHGRPRRARRR